MPKSTALLFIIPWIAFFVPSNGSQPCPHNNEDIAEPCYSDQLRTEITPLAQDIRSFAQEIQNLDPFELKISDDTALKLTESITSLELAVRGLLF
ncbi:MAG: hypothetical protein LBJ89_00980 [Holosporales bacterium]|nr:hypothetical protein [Holosporales bacterium]